MTFIFIKVTSQFFKLTQGYSISSNLSDYLQLNNANKIKCLNYCTKNSKCTLVYVDTNQNVCKLYMTYFINDYLVVTNNPMSQEIIYQRTFNS